MNLKDCVGKYFMWSNGVRFKVIQCGKDELTVECPNTGKTWQITPQALENVGYAKCREITEEEAKAKYCDISQQTIKSAFCSCCNWKIGKEELAFTLKLDRGKMPSDETNRLEEKLRDFFWNHRDLMPYVHSDEHGVRILFLGNKNEVQMPRPK